MPIISVFFGIVIRIYHADHNPPHFHATYGEFEAVFEIQSGKILSGKLPPQGQKLVEQWRKLNISNLNAAWFSASTMKTPKRIKGLE